MPKAVPGKNPSKPVRPENQNPGAPARWRRFPGLIGFAAAFASGFWIACIVWRIMPSGDFEACFQKGMENLRKERFGEAFELFAEAAQIHSGDPRPYYYLGQVYQQLFLTELAEKAYRQALKIDPTWYPPQKNLATILYDFSRYEEAMALLEKAEKQFPQEPFLWAEMALNQMRLGKPEEAIGLLERYNAAEGQPAWGLTHLARAHAEVGHLQEAEKLYRQSLKANPFMAISHFWLGQALTSLGRAEEAKPFFNKYHQMRGLETQEHSLKMALLREPNEVKTLVNLARTRYLLGKLQEALATLDKALELSPGDDKLQKIRREMARSLQNAGAGQPPRQSM